MLEDSKLLDGGGKRCLMVEESKLLDGGGKQAA